MDEADRPSVPVPQCAGPLARVPRGELADDVGDERRPGRQVLRWRRSRADGAADLALIFDGTLIIYMTRSEPRKCSPRLSAPAATRRGRGRRCSENGRRFRAIGAVHFQCRWQFQREGISAMLAMVVGHGSHRSRASRHGLRGAAVSARAGEHRRPRVVRCRCPEHRRPRRRHPTGQANASGPATPTASANPTVAPTRSTTPASTATSTVPPVTTPLASVAPAETATARPRAPRPQARPRRRDAPRPRARPRHRPRPTATRAARDPRPHATPRPTPKPTPRPTPSATPRPTPTPTPPPRAPSSGMGPARATRSP